MATKQKIYKRMTIAEKKARKEARERLREKGILSPPKARLNRKKFLNEVKEEFESLESYSDAHYLYLAISWMVPSKQEKDITSEQVGVLKLMKISVEIKKFLEQKRSAGETQYSPMELYEEAIQPILKL
ncbi:hypothetical protein [Niallia sp. 03190]|uniref:hypothetical protein n=1 Tax=Niallia sp. 03190 TaxID=3458061 RepID=UPI00404507D8